MITISLCMIVKNEELVISRCLDSIKGIVDEIIIVDTGSTDTTKEICRNYTDKIFDFEWIDDFSAARNYSYSKATMEYILWLDADDVVLEEDMQKLKKLKFDLDSTIDVVMMKYNLLGLDENGNIIFSFFRERLSKRSNNFKWVEPVHEYLGVKGIIHNSDIYITHKKEVKAIEGRNLSIYEKHIAIGNDLSARSLYYYGKELYENEDFNKAIGCFSQFLNREEGWIEDKIGACNLISKCYVNINDNYNSLKSLLRSLEYDVPRAENCCEIGKYFFNLNQYEKAIFWYKLAAESKVPTESWGFLDMDYYEYIPNLQLCVCYYNLGKLDEAIHYNLKALKFKPNDKIVLYNVDFFKKIKLEM